ncbi:hypothetical protein ACJJTC_009683 [Scirpophaga incertulas]
MHDDHRTTSPSTRLRKLQQSFIWMAVLAFQKCSSSTRIGLTTLFIPAKQFLEKGHTQNEGDSVHALIEREAEKKTIYTPDEWRLLVRWAKTTAKRLELEKKIYSLKPPCRKECRRKCYEIFNEEERENIWSNFRGLNKQEQRNYISRHVKKSKKSIKTKETSRRNNTLTWTLRNNKVCKVFFLNTLGFKNDQTIVTVLKANYRHGIVNIDEELAAPEQRGRAKPWNLFPAEYRHSIREYIEKIRPTVSHYNLKHAPNRRYLPCGVSFTDLYKAYIAHCDEVEIKRCSWAYFHGIVKEMNLSTSIPKQDNCTLCQNHKEAHASQPEHNCLQCDCCVCRNFPEHLSNRDLSRQSLERDVSTNNIEAKVFTADMQKAICMPKLTTKDYYFSRKLVLFNETFVSPGKNEPAFCLVWHEGESGRKAYNIASTYVQFIINHANRIKEIIIYCDNCTAQNKNRILFSAMIRLINSTQLICAEKIRFIYLEPGHTYMAADTVHACIANKFAKQKNMYDLDDYVNTIRAARKNMVVEVMTHNDMIVFTDELKKAAFPKNYNIQSLKVAEFRRGSTHMFVKNSYNENQFKELDVVRKNSFKLNNDNFLSELPHEEKRRGVSKAKKKEILKLCDCFPQVYRKFFHDLEEEDVLDLDGSLDIM